MARTKHEKAICQLNNSIVQYYLGDIDGCRTSLGESLKLSKSEIKFYIESSKIISEIIANNESISSLVKNA